MFHQIKSALSVAFSVLVASVLMLSDGCFDASSQRAERKRNATDSSVTSSRVNSHERMELASRRRVEDISRPTERLNTTGTTADETPVETTAFVATLSDRVENASQSPSTRTQNRSLPKTINWAMPEEKPATAEEKIAAETVAPDVIADTSTMPEIIVMTSEQAQVPPTEHTAQETTLSKADDNPFAAIAESLETIAEPPDDVVALPLSEDEIGEGIWEQAQPVDHDLLERLVIKPADESNAWRLRRDASGDQENAIVPDSAGDEAWQAVEPEVKPESEAESETQTVPDDVPNVPDMKPAVEPAMDLTMDSNLVPTLPNVQTDDGDLFGFDAADAFEQFGQMTDVETTTPAVTAPATTQSPAQQEKSIFGGWDDDESFDQGFGSGDDSTSSQPTVTPTPSAKPSQAQTTPGPNATAEADAPDTMEPLTLVEQYLVNEARMSSVKLMESVELLYKLNKPLLARQLLRQLKDTEWSADDCQQISKRINPAIMLRISLDEEYQPEGGQVVRSIVTGSQSYFESRSVIENAVQQLLTGTDREKDDATRTILNGGETSVEYLLERLAKSDDQQELTETMTLLYTMGESARRALQESLVPSTPLGMHAARLLTQMGRASDARFLMPLMFDSRLRDEERREVAGMVQTLSRTVPNQETAAATMYSMATNYFREKVPFMTDADNNVAIWTLREGSDLPKFVTVHESDASRYFAEKFARYATCLDPNKPAYRQLWMVAFFDLKGAELGSDNSITLDENLLRAMLTGLSVDDIESALRFAMQQGKPIAARVAAELMGEIGDVEAVIYKRGSQSALVKAAGFSDRRVRFAALRSIINLNPDRPYPGSSIVSQSLVYFTRATGKKRAIVVCPWLGDATTIANLLTPLGYTSETATMGRQAMQLAIDSADTELMMLDVRTPSSNVEFLVQDMRADNRTHDVPIAVLANGWVISRAERATYGDNRLDTSPKDATNRFVIGDDEFVVERDMMARAERAAFGSKMAHAFPRPYDEASAKFVVENLLRESGVEHVPPQLRLAEAKLSIEWATTLYQRSLQQKPSLYHFENIEQIAWDTLWLPELTMDTLPLVELIPTPNAQRWLTHIVSTTAFSIETREAALHAFEKNARDNGVLIRGRQILDLYDMYNASGGEPVASQQARSNLLDVVEKYANYMQNVSYQK